MTRYNRDNPHPFALPMVILDIETLGLRQDSVVWEIGVVLFTGWPDFEEIAGKAWFLNMEDQEQRYIDPKTVAWTSQVGGDGRRMEAFTDATKAGLFVSQWLAEYQTWVENNWLKVCDLRDDVKRDPCVWTLGTHFDIAMIENLLQEKKLRAPWKYDKPMDLRTLDRLLTLYKPDAPEKNPDEVPHDALGDCRLQLERFRLAFAVLDGAITSSACRHL